MFAVIQEAICDQRFILCFYEEFSLAAAVYVGGIVFIISPFTPGVRESCHVAMITLYAVYFLMYLIL